MVIGEFQSSDLLYLFKREKDIKNNYKFYCATHNKQVKFEYGIKIEPDLTFTLTFKLINNGNNGEIA